jgi:hypothetical protein
LASKRRARKETFAIFGYAGRSAWAVKDSNLRPWD